MAQSQKISLLNPEQQKAVEHVEGPMLIIAGAGSGKTRVVIYRIAMLLDLGVPANEILAVTFTNKAAEEMRHRVEDLCKKSVLATTFHSLCARILRESITHLNYKADFTIYDDEDSEKLLRQCLSSLGIKDEAGTFKKISGTISEAKNHLIGPEKFPKNEIPASSAYSLYQQRLKEANAVDFDDLLFLTVQLFRDHPNVLEHYQQRWLFLLIDEYQDTNYVQATLVKLLAGSRRNVFAVGDPDQSIYSWRGANIGNILKFQEDYPNSQIITLDQNYRSKTHILKAANGLILHNKGRHIKNLWSELGEGEKVGLYICDSERQEAEFVLQRLLRHHKIGKIPYRECVIFYRTNFQSRLFEDALLREKIPYKIIGGLSFYQRKEIKDILAFLRMLVSSTDLLAFARTINLPKRGIGEATIQKIFLTAQERSTDLLSALEALLRGESEVRLNNKQIESFNNYLSLIENLREMNHLSLKELIETVVEKTQYLSVLKDDPETEEEKRANIEELIAKAYEWEQQAAEPSLIRFLEELSLLSSTDQLSRTDECVRLMTLHNGKGLEFTVVFLVGMEEDLLPHIHSKEDNSDLEEERRLCYVGMTRAKEFLYLTAARLRFLWGTQRKMRPSRFLFEIPQEYLQTYQAGESIEGSNETIRVGDKVFHRDFGTGTVQKSYRTSLGETYDVYFEQSRITRSLVAKYAKLSKVN